MSSGTAVRWKFLLGAGLALIFSAVMVAIEAVPYLMIGFSINEQIGTSATGHSKLKIALALAGAGVVCIDLYRRRDRPGSLVRGQRQRLSVAAFRRIIWTLFLVEVGFFAWIVFVRLCPNELVLESARAQLGLRTTGPQGMARCWTRFLSYSAVAGVMTGIADVVGRRFRQSGAGA